MTNRFSQISVSSIPTPVCCTILALSFVIMYKLTEFRVLILLEVVMLSLSDQMQNDMNSLPEGHGVSGLSAFSRLSPFARLNCLLHVLGNGSRGRTNLFGACPESPWLDGCCKMGRATVSTRGCAFVSVRA